MVSVIFLPIRICLFPKWASTPCPGIVLKSVGSGIFKFISVAFAMIALDKGCSENFSAIAVYLIVSVSEKFLKVLTSTTLGSPIVKVPVLSNATSAVSYTHLRAHETDSYLVCRLLLEKKKKKNQ